MPDQTALRLGTTLTLSFWMKLDSVPSAATRLVGKGASDTAQNYGVWTAAGDQHLFFKFHNGTTLQSVSTTTTFSTGIWYHVAVTLGSGQVQFFVNGAAQTAVAATGTPVTSTDPLTFGYAGYNGTFGGSLDEVSLFNTVLTSSQVSELYATYGMGLVCRYNVGTDLIGQERYSAATSLWAASYYGYDGLGSVRVLYDSIGTTTDTYIYDAFGTLNSSTGSTTNYYRFAGEQWDEDLKLYYNRARYLNPDTGRFTSRDTFEAGSGDIGNLHRYLYVGGDPLNQTDPTGHESLVELQSVSGIINTINSFSRATSTAIRIYNKAQSFVNFTKTIGRLSKIVAALQGSDSVTIMAALQQELTSAFGGADLSTLQNGFEAAFKYVSSTWSAAASKLKTEAPKIERVVASYLASNSARYARAAAAGKLRFVIYAPSAPVGGYKDIPINVNKSLQINLSPGGGRLFGFGLGIDGQVSDQLFRLDYWDFVSKPSCLKYHYHMAPNLKTHHYL